MFQKLITIKDNLFYVLKHGLAKASVASFGLNIIASGLGFTNSVILARILGASNLGVYAYIMALTQILTVPSSLGLSKLIVRDVAKYQVQSSLGLMKGLLQWSSQAMLFASLLFALIAAGIGWKFSNINEDQILTFYIALFSMPMVVLSVHRSSVLRGLNRTVIAQLPESLVSPLLLIILVAGLFFYLGANFNVTYLILIKVVVSACTFASGVLFLHQNLPKNLKNVNVQYNIPDWIRGMIPFSLIEGTNIIANRADIIMLGAIKGSDAVGIYSTVSQLVNIIVYAMLSVGAVIAPKIASTYIEKDIQKLQQLASKSALAIFLFALPIALLLSVFGDSILLIFGNDFTTGRQALRILCVGQLLNAASGLVGWFLSMTGNEKILAITVVANMLLNVILNWILIPRWGVSGAALSSATSTIILNIIAAIFVYKKIGINVTILGKFRYYKGIFN